MTAFEPFIAKRYVRSRLIQSATLAGLIGTSVYADVAPSGSAALYVLMTVVSAEDLMVVGADRVWSNVLMQVEAWGRTADDAVVAQVAAAIDAALHDTSGTMTGADYGSGAVFSSVRERALLLPPEIDGDVIWRRAGGEYRLKVQASA